MVQRLLRPAMDAEVGPLVADEPGDGKAQRPIHRSLGDGGLDAGQQHLAAGQHGIDADGIHGEAS